MRSIVLAAFLLGAGVVATGCTATVASDPYPPDLVYAAPGVQVIADYNEPIFYSDGYYWRYYGGTWYRSSYYTGGWVYARPPVAVMRIDRPHAYVHYRPQGYVGRSRTVGPAPASGWRGHADDARLPRRTAGRRLTAAHRRRPGLPRRTAARGGPQTGPRPIRRHAPRPPGPPARGAPASRRRLARRPALT